jgi:hypothetical protein
VRRFDTIFENLLVTRATIDIPSIGPNGTTVIDVTATGVALGTHIISWTPLTTATTMDDLSLTFMVVADDLIRVVITNPTGGSIDPDSIDFEFVSGTVNPNIDP